MRQNPEPLTRPDTEARTGLEPVLALLQAEGLVKSYGRRRVVDGVSLVVGGGEIVGLLGPNGAGKTTTFRMLMGMIPAVEGRVFLKGRPIMGLPMYRRARLGMGYLSQEPSVFLRLTVEQNLLAILETRPLNRRQRRERAGELLAEFGLERVARQRADTLSGGESRRLEIARALVSDPALLMLDEPFSGVDPIAVGDIQEFIRTLRDRGIGVLLTDHNVRDTLSVTNRSYVIDDGKILAHGTPEQIVADPLVVRAYLGERFRL